LFTALSEKWLALCLGIGAHKKMLWKFRDVSLFLIFLFPKPFSANKTNFDMVLILLEELARQAIFAHRRLCLLGWMQ